MAGIDKTYIDGKEYPIYRNWWIENYEKMKKELGSPIYLYTFCIFDEDEITPDFLTENNVDIERVKHSYDFPIWNTSERIDKWLIKNCTISSFRQRMLDVYPSNWKGFKGECWVPKPRKKQRYIR